MISVCIPVYNYDAVPLVRSLCEQSASVGSGVEVVCIDDCSAPEWRERNAELASMANYICLEENVGRARIRNLFLRHTEGEYLLFLDVDSEVRDGFLARYEAALLDGRPAVVVGGRVYDRRGNDTAHRLRYLYGTRVESKSFEWRQRHPYSSFMSNNFAIRRDVLEQHPFDERIVRYGHEDTLFGYMLERAGVEVVHIDNPVVNGEVETNRNYLDKTVEAVENLATIDTMMADDRTFGEHVRLVAAYRRLRQYGLVRPVEWLYKLLRRPLESHFLTGNAITVPQFNFYKLGVFIKSKNALHSNQKT